MDSGYGHRFETESSLDNLTSSIEAKSIGFFLSHLALYVSHGHVELTADRMCQHPMPVKQLGIQGLVQGPNNNISLPALGFEPSYHRHGVSFDLKNGIG